MSTKLVSNNPYLITSRDFSKEAEKLSIELNKTYIDIANIVNARVIGLFPAGIASITGELWYLQGGNQKQQGFRQVYPFTAAGSIPHGITTSQIYGFVKIYGTFTDGSVWYPLPFVSEAAANNQISVQVTSTNIVITAGGGSPPTIQSGIVVLEWLSAI